MQPSEGKIVFFLSQD